MKKNERFEKRSAEISEDVKLFVDKSFEIVEQISAFLKHNNLSQKDLASMLGKEPSEVSRWMSGTHNFTLKSIAKLEVVMKSTIVCCKKQPVREYNIFVTRPNTPITMKGLIDYGLPNSSFSMHEFYVSGSTLELNTKIIN